MPAGGGSMSDMTSPRQHPLDMVLEYATPSEHGLGQRLSMETISARLSQLPIRPVLRLLGVASHFADRALSGKRAEAEARLVDGLLRPQFRERLANLQMADEGIAFCSSQQTLQLALLALRHCPDTESEGPTDLSFRLGDLIVALADHLSDGPGSSRDELLLDLVRNALFYRLNGVLDWFDAAYGLFVQTAPTLTEDVDFVDIDALLRDRVGMPLDLYWAVSTAVGVAAAGSKEPLEFPLKVGSVPQSAIDRWHSAVTQGIEVARENAEADLAAVSFWSFGTFFSGPLIPTRPGSFPVMRSAYLSQRASVAGLYYTVFDLLPADRRLAWSRFFGRVLEQWGKRRIAAAVGEAERLSYPDDRPAQANARKACDVLIATDDSVIAIDFVHRMLSLGTQATGDVSSFVKDMQFAVIQKLGQIDNTLAAELTGTDSRIARIYPMVVVSGPLPRNPLVEGWLDGIVSGLDTEVVGVDARCRPVATVEPHELEMALGTCQANGVALAELLEEWLQSPLGGNNLRDWLVTQETLEVARAGRGEYWEKAMYEIFGETP